MTTPMTHIDKIFHTFKDQPFSEHGNRWDSLWREEFTPWDRGGPSMALHDLLAERPDLVPPASGQQQQQQPRRPTALVPGCGRGYDVLLLAAFGYDVYGLDYSPEATRMAARLEKEVAEAGAAADPAYGAREGVERGKVTLLTGDFFKFDFEKETGVSQFDLIFDYTFLCALPLSARPQWAKRITSLLSTTNPAARLVCLQWPTAKPFSAAGPPWGLVPEHYAELLGHPGREVEYDPESDGRKVVMMAGKGAEEEAADETKGLKMLELVTPRRTHTAGLREDGTVNDRILVFARS